MCLLLYQFIFIHPPIICRPTDDTSWIITLMSIVQVIVVCSSPKAKTLSKPEPVQTGIKVCPQGIPVWTGFTVLHLFLGKLVGNIIFDLENHIFAYLTITFTFWPWGWPLIIKIVQLNLIFQSKTHQKEVLHLLLFAFVKNNISQFWP